MSDRDERFPQDVERNAPPQDEQPRGRVDETRDTDGPDGSDNARPEGGDRSTAPDPRDLELQRLRAENDQKNQFLMQVRESILKQQREKLQQDEEARYTQVIEAARDMDPDAAIQHVAQTFRSEARQRAEELQRLGQQQQYEREQMTRRDLLSSYAHKRVTDLGLDEDSQRALAQQLSLVGDIQSDQHRDQIGAYIESTTQWLLDQQALRTEATDLRERAGLASIRKDRSRRGTERAGTGGGRSPKDYSNDPDPALSILKDNWATLIGKTA